MQRVRRATASGRRTRVFPLGARQVGGRSATVIVGLALATAFASAPAARAQAPDETPDAAPPAATVTGAPTPEALADLVLDRFIDGPPAAFDSVYPETDARELVQIARAQGIPLRAGAGRVLEADGDRAVLYLSGRPAFANSGDETIYARNFSGLYAAVRADDGWRLDRRLPIDAANRITRQTIDATLEPGRGLRVTDTLEIDVGGPHGFWAFLNHAVRLDRVTVDGEAAEHIFESGLLWVRAPARDGARLALEYRVDVARDSAQGPNSGRFEADYGHVRNQYFWHPFFDFSSEGDRAHFDVTVRAPADVAVVTSIAQTDTVVGDRRIVRGRTEYPTFALTLLYDRGWEPVTLDLGGLRAELFVTPDFKPSPEELGAAIEQTYRSLSDRFGEPGSKYVAVVQGRARGEWGWHFRSNNLIAGGAKQAPISRSGALPRTWLGHEVAHGWTTPTGPGANFLSEGWATFAEAVILADEHGPETAEAFWENYRNWYDRGGFEGEVSIMNDPNNQGIAYPKGGWILHMLRHVVGDDAFRAGLRGYMSIPPGRSAGIEELTAAMSDAAGRDIAPFLRPWLEEKVIPDVRARIEDDRAVVTQHGPVFRLPLELEIVTAAGPVRRRIDLAGREQTLDIRDLDGATDVLVDPDHRFLLRRHRGEVVRFEHAAAVAEAVQIDGDFISEPLDATLVDGVWTVEIPLTEGRYVYWWLVDGEFDTEHGNGVRVVRPLEAVADAYPR